MMKPYAVILLFLISVPIQVWAQEPAYEGQLVPTFKEWQEGPVTWSDFHGFQFDPLRYSFNYRIGLDQSKLKVNDTVFISLKAYNIMERSMSWAASSQRLDTDLRYIQLVFDISELYRRRLQMAAYTARNVVDLQQQFAALKHSSDQMVEELKVTTDEGGDGTAMDTWRTSIDSLLQTTSPEEIPFTPTDLGMGMHVGFGVGNFVGEYDDHYRSAWTYNYGFDFGYKRTRLFLWAALGATHVSLPPTEVDGWRTGRTALAAGDISLGHAVVDARNWRTVPHLGIGFLETNQRTRSETKPYPLLQTNAVVFGTVIDRKFKKQMKVLPGPWSIEKGYNEFSIRARIQYSHSIAPEMKGGMVQVMIGVTGYARFVRLKSRS